VCAALAEVRPAPVRWTEWWEDAEAAAQAAIASVLAWRAEVTEPGVARTLTSQLARHATLFVSSSMPLRDVEWYGAPTSAARVLANRGANGIDGIVSSALGVAAASSPTVALLGDLAFLHDIGGLLGAPRRDTQLVLVVIDNNGGGIFSFLSQAEQLSRREFERLFATPHDVDLIALAKAYGVTAERIEQPDQVGPAVAAAIASRGVRVIVVPTDRDANRDVHEELTQAVAKSLAGIRPLP